MMPSPSLITSTSELQDKAELPLPSLIVASVPSNEPATAGEGGGKDSNQIN